MASKAEYMKVDPDKLRTCVKDAAGNLNKAAATIGCGSALHNAMNRGILAKPIVYALEREYGIAYEDYAVDAKPKNSLEDEMMNLLILIIGKLKDIEERLIDEQ